MSEQEKKPDYEGQVRPKVKIKGIFNFHLADGTVKQVPFEGEKEIQETKDDSGSS